MTMPVFKSTGSHSLMVCFPVDVGVMYLWVHRYHQVCQVIFSGLDCPCWPHQLITVVALSDQPLSDGHSL